MQKDDRVAALAALHVVQSRPIRKSGVVSTLHFSPQSRIFYALATRSLLRRKPLSCREVDVKLPAAGFAVPSTRVFFMESEGAFNLNPVTGGSAPAKITVSAGIAFALR